MRKLMLMLMVIAGCAGCSDKSAGPATVESFCSGDDVAWPMWLQDIKQSLEPCTCQVSILQGTYKNEMVFFTRGNDPVCLFSAEITLYNCKGEPIRIFTAEHHDEFRTDVTGVEELYTCSKK